MAAVALFSVAHGETDNANRLTNPNNLYIPGLNQDSCRSLVFGPTWRWTMPIDLQT